jgi:hypothetical protein
VLDAPLRIEEEHLLIFQDQEEENNKDPFSSFMYGLKAPETEDYRPLASKIL